MKREHHLEVGARESDIAFMAPLLATGDPRIATRNGRYTIEWGAIQGEQSVDVLYDRAFNELQPIINQWNLAVRLLDDTCNGIGPKHIGFYDLAPEQPVPANSVATPIAPAGNPSDLQKIVRIAALEQRVQRVLTLWGYMQRDGASVYKIFEIIRDDVGGEPQIIAHRWSTNTRISSFRGSVNNPNVMGEYARHGTSNQRPPRNPMTVADAEQFTQGLARDWAIWKYDEAARNGRL